jgi:hypothetical protein
MIYKTDKERIPTIVVIILLLLALIIGFGGWIFYHTQKKKITFEKQNELGAIAALKINQIENWRMEHIRDGEIFRSFFSQDQTAANLDENSEKKDQSRELSNKLKILISNYDYHSILLVDTAGSVRFQYPTSDSIPSINLMDIDKNPDLFLSDLHYSDDLPGKINLDVQIPLFVSINNKNVRFGTILLRIDPEKILYPLIQSWPTPSKSSETLLVRRQGDSVIYLNELRSPSFPLP